MRLNRHRTLSFPTLRGKEEEARVANVVDRAAIVGKGSEDVKAVILSLRRTPPAALEEENSGNLP